ncbi:flagellar hook-basal body protein [Cohnella hongkongensis]|uniref:Flagellar hook-basal body protein n=1 Tax=Cohnella hongkongensis TaxID=178337 RepID=A0ABV9FCS7_9BACL
MNSSMITAAVSMGALQQRLDLLADNVANLNTVGYKRKTAVFEDILTSVNRQLEDFNQPGRKTPLGLVGGWGTKLVSIHTDMTQGSLQETGIMTDVAIEGNGLFEVRTADGARAFTRHGPFQLLPDGEGERVLLTNTGQQVIGVGDEPVRVPNGYDLRIAEDGALTGVSEDGLETVDLGRLKLVELTNSDLLRALADNLFGIPADVDPGSVVRELADGDVGIAVRQGFVEQSNVSMAEETSDLMMVQRAYQLSARALSSSEQMMGLANSLRG